MRLAISKLKAILLYFCNFTDKRLLGKTKLMKLFYFLDFVHTKKYGTPITYDTYVNLEHGPIPSTIKNLVDNLAEDPKKSVIADTIEINISRTAGMHKVRPLKKFTEKDAKMFSQSELKILREVCERFKQTTAQEIERVSHNEAPWKQTGFTEEIPYELAAEDKDCKFSKEEIQLLLQTLS